jgi:hypothetical protein
MIRAAALLALIALAACAPAQQPQVAAPAPAPSPAPAVDPYAITVQTESPGVFRVTGGVVTEDALAPLHCAAAKRARTDGAKVLEWVGGIASPRGDEYTADLVYDTTAKRATRVGKNVKPEDGGVVAVENWLIYCDEAGIPREGKA